MPDTKNPTAAEKLVMLQQLGQQYVASGQAPSPQVQVALRSFQTAPTPEEIQKVADDMARGGNPAAAVEFQAYASAMAAPQNKLRQAAQARADAGVGPSPPVVEALNSFDEPPSPQEIQTMRRYLQKKHGEAVGQEFETYAATALAQKAQQLPPSARPDAVRTPARAPAPAPAQQQAPVAQAGMAEPGLLQRAKDVAQGVGRIVTLGAIPAPESVLSGNDRLRGMVGMEPLERGGKKKEKDLVNEAKKVRQGKTDTTPINIEDIKKRKDQLLEEDTRDQFRHPREREVNL